MAARSGLIGNVRPRGAEGSAGRGEGTLASQVARGIPGLWSPPVPKVLTFIHFIHSLC